MPRRLNSFSMKPKLWSKLGTLCNVVRLNVVTDVARMMLQLVTRKTWSNSFRCSPSHI